jgi:hypothetical protein
MNKETDTALELLRPWATQAAEWRAYEHICLVCERVTDLEQRLVEAEKALKLCLEREAERRKLRSTLYY